MRRNWQGIRSSFIMLFLFGLTSCGLALPEAESADRNEIAQDRLAGVVVTSDYLDMGMPELEFNDRGEVAFKETQSRIYGTFDEDAEGRNVTFEGVEGAGLYSLRLWDEAQQIYVGYSLVDGPFSGTSVKTTDEGDTVEATIYVCEEGIRVFYFNPVYQTKEGEIYLVQGSGISCDSWAEGQSMAQTISAETSRTENGVEERKADSFTVHITFAAEPESTEILFFDEENKVIGGLDKEQAKELFLSDEVPELSVPEEAAYLMAVQELGETTSGEYDGSPGKASPGKASRVLCNRGEDGLELRGMAVDGFLQNRWVQLIWE